MEEQVCDILETVDRCYQVEAFPQEVFSKVSTENIFLREKEPGEVAGGGVVGHLRIIAQKTGSIAQPPNSHRKMSKTRSMNQGSVVILRSSWSD